MKDAGDAITKLQDYIGASDTIPVRRFVSIILKD
jgi:hypothetical protein